jgi:uncharacterized protein YjbJ (UPF0337 family)
LAIPGVGSFIAAGPILGALAGVGAGGAVGGLIGALVGLGIREYEAKRYEGHLKNASDARDLFSTPLECAVKVVNIEQTIDERCATVIGRFKRSPADGTPLPNRHTGSSPRPQANGEDMKPSTTDQVQGTLHEVKGDVKEKAGQVTGDPDLTNEGQAEKLAGTVQKKVGQVEKVIGQ